jgi:hypothetical protein
MVEVRDDDADEPPVLVIEDVGLTSSKQLGVKRENS